MFVPLHVKSDYSIGFGTASVRELVQRAASLGYGSVALTDLENLYGQVQFHHECRLSRIRPVTGVELRPGFDGVRNVGNRAGRIVLLAMDRVGYRSLCRIVSRRRDGEILHESGDPLPLVMEEPEGLVALSDDPTVMERLAQSGRFAPEKLGMLLIRPESAFLDRARQAKASALGIRVIADLDTVFPERGDHPLHRLQLAIKQGLPLRHRLTVEEGSERWLRSPAAAAALFADLPHAVAATEEIARMCRFDLESHGQKNSLQRTSDGHDAGRLRQLCDEAVFDRREQWTQSHRARLDEELAIFAAMHFSGFMLVVGEILSHCREEGIPVVVRGSAVSSLTLHLLGGSPVDPLAHGLLFERFLHARKSSWPDVDIDLPWHRRDDVIAWVYGRFGHDRVAMVAAHHTFQLRSAVRDGLKACGVSPTIIEAVGRALPPDDLAVEEVDFLGLPDAAEESAPIDGSLPGGDGTVPEVRRLLPLIRRLVGKPRHLAVHPGGIVVDHRPLQDLLPLERAPKGVVVTQYDLVAVARLGFVKIDLLGNRCLSELDEALRLAGHPQPLRLDSIPLCDPAALALADSADTLGCFQLESPAMRALLARLPISSESDLVAALALIRPGASSGEVKTSFIRRARGEEPDNLPFPMMADRLTETHGLFLYEEDIMVLLSRTGGLTLAEADEMRKGIVASGGDAVALAELKKEFLHRARAAKTVPPSRARLAWETAARFAAYSFNKAHAASYGLLAYCSAYTKAHYPVPFACALLNHHQGMYPLRTLAAEWSRRGIEVRPPHVNASHYHSTCEPGEGEPGAVRVGLDKIKSLTRRAAREIVGERLAQGNFLSLRNLLERIRLSAPEASALVLSGTCDDLHPLSAVDYPFPHEAVRDLLRRGGKPEDLDELSVPRPVDAEEGRVQLFRRLMRVRNELRYLQMHPSAHPLALLRDEARRYGCTTIGETAAAPAGTTVRLVVTVAALRRVPTRQGPMQFMSLEDETGLLEAVVLPPAYRRMGERVATSGPFLVEGNVRRQQGAMHLDVMALSPFHERRRPFGK